MNEKSESQKFHQVVEPRIATNPEPEPRVVKANDWKLLSKESCEHHKAPGVHGDPCRLRGKNRMKACFTMQVFALPGDVGMLYLGVLMILNLLLLPQFLKQY